MSGARASMRIATCGTLLAMRWLIIAACACRSSTPSDPVAPRVPAPPKPAALQPITPVTIAVANGDRVLVYLITREAAEPVSEAKLPEPVATIAWLDDDHVVALGESGTAYRIAGTHVDPYKMPARTAWQLPIGKELARETFPNRLTVAGDGKGTATMASCVGYILGDDDPCEVWALATLDNSLVVGRVYAGDDAREAGRPDVAVDAPAGMTAELESAAAPTIRLACTRDGKTARRTWDVVGPCNTTADIHWLSTQPPILAARVTTDCGEGAPSPVEHVLRGCELTDVADDTDTFAWADGVWAMRASGGWSIRSGDRELAVVPGEPVTHP